jgi:hypothetical protein
MEREVVSYKKTTLYSPGDPPLKTNSILATFATQFLLLPADMRVEEVVLDKKRLILVLSPRQLTAAALSSAWSQGQVEGQITRLKLLKRHMYGRAKFDLLRLWVFHAA